VVDRMRAEKQKDLAIDRSTADASDKAGASERALVALVAAMMLLITLFAGVLAPLLPQLKHEIELSTFEAGVLVAMYGLGGLVGIASAALLSPRAGVKRTALTGILVLAVGTAAFGLAHSFPALLAARVTQGAGDYACGTAALAWMFDVVASRRRGEMTGLVLGAGAAGGLLGPLFGGAAAALGRGPLFVVAAAVALALALAATRFPSPPPLPAGRLRLRAALDAPRVRSGILLSGVPPLMLTAVAVLAPLQLHHLGARAGTIAACFAAAALVGMPLKPLVGRWSDRRGRVRPVRTILVVALPLIVMIPWAQSTGLAFALIALVLIAGSALWAPLLMMLSDACGAAGATQVAATTLVNLAGAPAEAAGPAGAGAIAQAAGQRVAYAALGAVVLVSLIVLARPVG
jgi:MFS family permease